MAFHSYPHVIRKLFNAYRFGPPAGVTRPSACARVDHLVSRLPPLTPPPCSDSLSLRLRACRPLTSPTTATRGFIMQKARGHGTMAAPTACRHTISGSLSLPCPGFFSPFPHGTGPLSVSRAYLALRDGPRGFGQDFSCPALLRQRLSFGRVFGYGALTLSGPPFQGGSPNAVSRIPRRPYYPGRASTPPVWAPPLSIATTRGIIVIFFSCGY